MSAIIPVAPVKRYTMNRKRLEEDLSRLKKVRQETEQLTKDTKHRDLRLQAVNNEILKIARELEHLDRTR